MTCLKAMTMQDIDVDIKKTCKKCYIEKPLSDFGKRNGKVKYKYNRDSWCKICKREYEYNRIMLNPEKKAKFYAVNKKWQERNRGRYKNTRFASKWKRLGIDMTWEIYDKMLDKQNNLCAICGGEEIIKGKKIALSVDHDHNTNKVRGLLCGNCNRAIGLLKDSPEVLMNAYLYIKNNQ